jgi:hypothetical protein
LSNLLQSGSSPLFAWLKHYLWPPPWLQSVKNLFKAKKQVQLEELGEFLHNFTNQTSCKTTKLAVNQPRKRRRRRPRRSKEPTETPKPRPSVKQLSLSALLIAATRLEAMPTLTLCEDRRLKRDLRRAVGSNGVLNTSRLRERELLRVREALSKLPAYLYQPHDSQLLIIDTGASDTATSFKEDLIPETIEALHDSKPMDGIAGSLYATHKGRARYELLADD